MTKKKEFVQEYFWKQERREECEGCFYLAEFGTCDYLLMTGHSRVKDHIPAGAGCTVKLIKPRPRNRLKVFYKWEDTTK